MTTIIKVVATRHNNVVQVFEDIDGERSDSFFKITDNGVEVTEGNPSSAAKDAAKIESNK